MSRGATRWERAAEQYATGEHKSGRELDLVVEFAGPKGNEHVLDVGAGAGHTALALAPHVRSVVVTDPVDGMLAAARRVFEQAGARNAEFVTATAEHLPFPNTSFEIVTSRLAAHHFDDVALAMREIARVLRQGGTFIFCDTIAPGNPVSAAFQHEFESLRDPTHRRIYMKHEWMGFVRNAGFRVSGWAVVYKTHEFESWLERGSRDELTRERVRHRFLEAPQWAVRQFRIVTQDGQVKSFTDPKLVLAARRQAM